MVIAKTTYATTEKLWGLVQDETRTSSGLPTLCYGSLQPTAAESWRIVVEDELLGTGHTRASLKRAGWSAKPLTVTY